MTYSCARFETRRPTWTTAQAAKHELICRKLGLGERPACACSTSAAAGAPWRSTPPSTTTSSVVGITISQSQADLRPQAGGRGRASPTASRSGCRTTATSPTSGSTPSRRSGCPSTSASRASTSTSACSAAPARRRGRLLNHAISAGRRIALGGSSFIGRYVFPDGELIDVGVTVSAMERAGFEVRDVESLREHYARTLRAWVANLEANWDEAVDLVGVRRARSGGCTWPARRSASPTARSTCTRCSASCRQRTDRAACPRPAATGTDDGN